ncbi:MAG: (4Fe-4S)-binding protein [Bacillota bacterium]
MVRRYSNGEITVIWKPDLCNHNGNCWRRLPEVFDPKKRPWVTIGGAPSGTIIEVVDECPTGALTWERA